MAGYKQELDRSTRSFASFAAGVGFVQGHKPGVLEAHRFQAASEAVPPGPVQPAGAGSPE